MPRQTEQSIRLGMWMDWNDPDELRRLRDMLATDPSEITTIEGPSGLVTDTVEMLVGRLGMPEIAGSYFTFSNENNDLICGSSRSVTDAAGCTRATTRCRGARAAARVSHRWR